MALMGRRGQGRCSSASLVYFAILGGLLAGSGGALCWAQAAPAQTAPASDPADLHTITITFDYNFDNNPSCAEKPALKRCVKQFVVYDISVKKVELFSIPVPDGAHGLVKGIQGESPMRIFLPGKHYIAVTAQNADGLESPVSSGRIAVEIKPKAADSNPSAK
jgi:hypothetical protein